MFKQYGGFRTAIAIYWSDYGGWSDFLRSPLLHVSVIVAIFESYGLLEIDWRILTIGMMPTILGFSLAAYAITFALMGSRLQAALTNGTDASGKSLAITVNATLFHNVFFQAISLAFAVITNGDLLARLISSLNMSRATTNALIHLEITVGNLAGCFFLVYAVFLLFSSGLAMFRLGRLLPSRPAPAVVANDAPPEHHDEPSAHETYGFRWTIIRAVAKILRVKG